MSLIGSGDVRDPVVAGAFYPGNPAQLETAVERLLVRTSDPRKVIALMVPHAGYIYSGSTAGKAIASAELPKRLIILCPNHTGMGAPISCWSRGTWKTPLGGVHVDEELAGNLIEVCPGVTADTHAHMREHAIEVVLPFLQIYLEEFTFVPIAIATAHLETLLDLGRGLAEVLRGAVPEAALIVSTDMNHYENASTNRKKDDFALDAVTRLDAEALHDAVITNNISMCGFAPTVAAISAAVRLGADRSEVVDYTHSGMVTGDDREVVSYAGVRIWKDVP